MNQNRQKLISALRSPMPEHFAWDFGHLKLQIKHTNCATIGCALGLASIIFPNFSFVDSEVAAFFGLKDEDTVSKVFYKKAHYSCEAEVTPEMVATALEDEP